MISTKRSLLLGHRGARRLAPENTVAAFDLALAHGCDGFEFDVRLTRDGRAIVCHDPTFAGLEVVGSDFSELASRMKTCCALERVIERFAARAFLDIELKVRGIEALVAELLLGHEKKRFVVSSFLPEVLRELSARNSEIPLGYICDRRETLARWREMPCEFVIPHCSLLDENLVSDLHDAGKQIFVWTVNRASEMKRFAQMGVDGMISDDTEVLCRTLGGEQRSARGK